MLFRRGLASAGLLPLFAAWPFTASPYVLPKLAVLGLAAAAASLGAVRASEEPGPGKRAASVSLLAPLAACLAALALTSLSSAEPALSLLGEPTQRAHGFLTLALCAVVAALAQGAGPEPAAFALFAGAASGAALSAYGLLQFAGLDPVLNTVGGHWYGRAASLVGSPTGLGCVLAMLLPL